MRLSGRTVYYATRSGGISILECGIIEGWNGLQLVGNQWIWFDIGRPYPTQQDLQEILRVFRRSGWFALGDFRGDEKRGEREAKGLAEGAGAGSTGGVAGGGSAGGVSMDWSSGLEYLVQIR